MALVAAASQIPVRAVKTLTWEEVYARLEQAPPGKLWGVPRGGAIVAGLTGRAVDEMSEADAIVDDVIDSGRTRSRYDWAEPPFWALVDKLAEGLMGTWIRFPWEPEETHFDLEHTVIRQLEWLGEDPRREGLRDTPGRVLRAMREMTQGYQDSPEQILAVQFHEPCDEMVLVKQIPFSSLCEHHLLPFVGMATVGYIPQDHCVVGLSKIPRLVQCFARRLQTQERLTQQIAQTLMDILKPLGAGVLMEAEHSCMRLRGVQSHGTMTTSCLLGVMRDQARDEFLKLAQR